MRATIDSGGRVVIPKAVRERLGLTEGSEVELTERDGALEVAPVATPVRLVKGRYGVVAVAERDVPPLTAEVVRDALERHRR
jgi:AbrB family looped-hinge helix DNA binding protein